MREFSAIQINLYVSEFRHDNIYAEIEKSVDYTVQIVHASLILYWSYNIMTPLRLKPY